ncbi:MAG: TonB-dependent receptor [Cyclobacteriaceae bacterium]|nr:TonB-dependent receptor [Cyclobacteriaceae bacterium]
MSIIKRLSVLTLFFFLVVLQGVKSQSKYDYEFKNVSLDSAIHLIEVDNKIRVYYLPEWVDNQKINNHYSSNNLKDLLDNMLYNVGLSCIIYSSNTYILIKQLNDGQVIEEHTSTGEVIKKITVGDSKVDVKEATISGRVFDVENKLPLPGATIYSKELKKGAATDIDGYYEMILPTGEHALIINSLGYHQENYNIILQSSGTIDVSLLSSRNTLDEVIIKGLKMDNGDSEGQMSKDVLKIESLEYVPTLMGEKDVVKSMNLLPGVVSGEGSNGYSVRGGGYGQNLIFLENTPLYNSSHLFGLFSVFNSGVVDNLTIFKGTMPAKYGGRVSSVMDINLKDGKNENWAGEAAIGLISSRIAFDGPITKKLSIVSGGRMSYFNRYLNRIENNDIKNSQGSFYDANAKLFYAVSDKSTLSINGFTSYDDFTLPEGERITYSNQLASAKWVQEFSDNVHGDFDLTYSNYYSTIDSEDSLQQRYVKNSISTFSAKGHLSLLKLENHQINLGFESNLIQVDPGRVFLSNPFETSLTQIPKESGVESALYISDEYKLSDKITINLGLRYSYFALLGPGKEYIYEPNMPRRSSTLIDSLTYSEGEIIQSYGGLEPRFFFKYKINNSLDVKFNLGRSRQYLHLMSNSASISPLNIWKLSSSHLKPQVADQMAIGIFKKIDKKNIEMSYEFFYRHINDLPDFKNGAVLFNNSNIENQLVSGSGEAYGHELQLSKKTGKLSGWLSYTFSRSFNTMNSEIDEEKINNGNKYPSNYDIPHSISLTGDYMLTRLWSLSFNWLYNSGRPITYPESYYYHDGTLVAYYSSRNEYRIPDYHRLDLSLNLKGSSLKINKKWNTTMSFSVYNVYGRKNAYSVFFQRSGYQIVGKKLSIVAQPIPSITLTVKLR